MTTKPEIAIIGVGLHPFGRYADRSALEMGAVAIGRALADAGVAWSDVNGLWAGSLEVANPEAVTGLVGMTGLPARSTLSGCATGNSLLTLAARDVELGEADIAVAVGLDKHPRGAFGADPSVSGLPQWYGEQGMFLTTHYFGTKIMRYMHDHGISERTLARVSAKNLSNGALAPHAWRRNPISIDAVLESPVVNAPLRQFMYCNPNEGAAAVVVCRAEEAKQYTDTPIYLRSTRAAQPPRGRLRATAHLDRTAPGARHDGRGRRCRIRARRSGSRGRRRRPAPGHRQRLRAHPHGRDGVVQGRRARSTARRRCHQHRRPPAREHRRRSAGERRAGGRLRAASDLRTGTPTPRYRGRASGAQRPAGGARTALRRARHRGGRDPQPMSGMSVDEAEELARAVRAACDKYAQPEQLRAACYDGVGGDPAQSELWTVLCGQVGIAAIAIPEQLGGAGYGATALGVVARELGRALAPVPFLSSSVLAAGLLAEFSGHDAAAAQLLRGLADGARTAAAILTADGGWWSPGTAPFTARRDDDAWRIDGVARHVLGGSGADDLIALATIGDELALMVVDPTSARRDDDPRAGPRRHPPDGHGDVRRRARGPAHRARRRRGRRPSQRHARRRGAVRRAGGHM